MRKLQKNKLIITVLILLSLSGFFLLVAQPIPKKQITTVAQKGNGVLDLLDKFKLSKSSNNVDVFQKLNSGNFDKNGGLLLGSAYILPIQVIEFDGKSIRTTLNITDFNFAKKIEEYNLSVEALNLKNGNYKQTKELWIPYEFLILDTSLLNADNKDNKDKENKTSNPKINTNQKSKKEKPDYSYFQTNSEIKPKNKKLLDCAFYIIAGHGGPDPGAIGYRDGFELHEHEYAYDVAIRLAKKLIESSADVYMIVQDPSDGIRDDQILSNSGKEKLINGENISPIQINRLKQRTDIVNEFVQKNASSKRQMLIELHVDSRVTDKRIDIFFYHRLGCKKSEKLNKTLLKTIKGKYEKAQPGRGYQGTVSARDLFTLRNTSIEASFIELGNIQNVADQVRLIQANNRQAIANWLYDGIIEHCKK